MKPLAGTQEGLRALAEETIDLGVPEDNRAEKGPSRFVDWSKTETIDLVVPEDNSAEKGPSCFVDWSKTGAVTLVETTIWDEKEELDGATEELDWSPENG
jgi:hypothetical protein